MLNIWDITYNKVLIIVRGNSIKIGEDQELKKHGQRLILHDHDDCTSEKPLEIIHYLINVSDLVYCINSSINCFVVPPLFTCI